MIVIVETSSRAAVAFLFPQQTAVVDCKTEQNRARQSSYT